MIIPAKFLFFPFLMAAGAGIAVAQLAPSPAELARAKAIALELCIALQQQAEQMEAQGEPSGSLRYSFARKAGLNDGEQEAMLGVASGMRAGVTPLDENARAIIQAARQKYPGGRLKPGMAPPPPPPELAVLQRQRDRVVEQAVRDLDHELGSAGLAKLHKYLIETMLRKTP